MMGVGGEAKKEFGEQTVRGLIRHNKESGFCLADTVMPQMWKISTIWWRPMDWRSSVIRKKFYKMF